MIAESFPTWRIGWKKPDRRPNYQWLKENWILPPSYAQPGPFDISTSRHLIRPFEAVQADHIREATCCGAIQTGKTLWIEGSAVWATCMSPGPIMWTLQTDDDAREHCEQRFMQAYRSVPQIKAMLPEDRHKKQTAAVYFGPFFLEVNGANLNNLQRVSVRWKFNSEVWLWKQGLLSHGRGRVSAFEKAGNSKILNESQGGTAGDDFHEAWDAGDQNVWSIRCFGCKELTPLVFATRMAADPEKQAGVVWNPDAKRTDGTWNVGRAVETCRWVRPQCGHEHENSAKTRALWNETGDYIRQRFDNAPDKASFRWEALVARDMGALVSQFLEARKAQKIGMPQQMMDFTRQRRALPWVEEDLSEKILLKGAGYLLHGMDPKAKIENEAQRFMTIDRQRDHFWCVVRAWRNDGSSRKLFFSRVNTADQLEEIRILFNVEPQLTFEDSGYFPEGAYTDCARFGWTALKGSGDNFFAVVKNKGTKAETKLKRLWSDATKVQHNGVILPLFHWASDPIKDVLHNLRAGRGVKWETPDDVTPDYTSQIDGEKKRSFVNKKTGRPEFRWQKTRANHALDLEAMQVCVAMMLAILTAPAPKEPETVTNKPE